MKVLPLALFITASLGAQTPDLPPVHVEDVIESVRKRYPPLLAAFAEREIADSEVLAAEGRFDTTLRARLDSDSLGYYSNRRFDAWVDQPFAWGGTSLYSGYRVGDGDFAPYDGKLATRSLGELRTGLKLPLFRDRSLDMRRGELTKSRIGQKLASLSIEEQKLAVLQAGIVRYWNWVAQGRRLLVTRGVLEIAEARQKLLSEGEAVGQVPRIDVVDNARAILQRRSTLVEAERAFQQSAIDLSLFLRDAAGEPLTPGIDQVPVLFKQPAIPSREELPSEQSIALQRRPELGRLQAQADQNSIDVQLARNAAKPALDLFAGFVSESGTGVSVRRGPQEFKTGLSFEFPFQNRAARGKQATVEAKGRQLAIRSGFTRDQITAQVKDAYSALVAARDRLQLLSEEVQLSRELEQAERTRFELGEGTLFILNLREQATLDAAVREALAAADVHRARTAYDYATGALATM